MKETTQTTEATVTRDIPGKVVGSFTLPTPMWATWAFRIVFLLTTAGSVWIAATGLIEQDLKIEIMLALKVLDLVIWGIGKGLGVKRTDYENNPA